MWFSVLCLLVAYVVLKAAYMRWRYDLHRVPQLPALPVVGHALALRKAMKSAPISAVYRQWRQDLGNPKVMKVQLFGNEYVVVMNAECVRNVILAKSGGMARSLLITADWWKVLSFFMTPTPTPFVKTVRRTMARCMTSVAMKKQIPKMHSVWSSMESIIDRESLKGPINIEDLLVRCTLDASGLVFFDHAFGELDEGNDHRKTILEALLEMKALGRNRLKRFAFHYVPFLKSSTESRAKFQKVIDLWRSMAKTIMQKEDEGDPDVDMWAGLKQLRDPATNEPLDIQRLGAEVGTGVIGGMDTISHTMAWSMALLASNPHVTEKIVDEMQRHGLTGRESKNTDFDRLSQLEYLTAVLKETMRLVHVTVVTRRILDRDTTLCGYRLPKGTLIDVAGTNMVNSEDDWDEPLAFKPERWLRGEDMSKKFYFPFSNGERDCIGQRFAMTLMLFIMANFISRYRFELIEGETFDRLLRNQVIAVPVESEDGVCIHIRQRSRTRPRRPLFTIAERSQEYKSKERLPLFNTTKRHPACC